MRLLSRSAHGWAVALIIDVVENLRRQETKLPAVPPHYDIISEGWLTAAVYRITRAAPWHVQRRARSHSGHTHTPTCIHTCGGYKIENQIRIHSQMDTLDRHTQTPWLKR